ncbi:sphingolipid 8-(E)-desaturase [Malassezia sp. CBS 17886]|nr:sphingolipid 8-(E)-desaturase [Malassezia sp. CBS 17886]
MADETAPARLPRTVLTRRAVAERIARGEVIVLHGRLVYKLDNWIHKHPGGDLAILHFVGRDAKSEIEVYHSEDTIRTLMRRFAIAQLAPDDATDVARGHVYRPLMPPIQLGYRNGRLDHPDAQLSAWAAHERTHPGEPRPACFPLPLDLLEPPPGRLSLLHEARIAAAFERLHGRIKDAGLYTLRPSGYARECARYILFGTLSYACFQTARSVQGVAATALFLLSAVFLGIVWHQMAFTAHDAGHSGISHMYWLDRFIGVLVASYVGGLSLLWWCDSHDIHHLVTNHPEHDPDIQHMPIFAVSPRFVGADGDVARDVAQGGGGRGAGELGAAPPEAATEAHARARTAAARATPPAPAAPSLPHPTPALWSSYYRRVLAIDAVARILLQYQHRLFFVIMSIARFNLYALSYSFLLLRAKRDRWLLIEGVGVLVFWAWFGGLVLPALPSWKMLVAYLLISHIVTSPLHIQIVLSHFAQDTTDLGPQECFASRQVRTTMDVQCPSYMDFVHGGLHMQVTHHLFPRLPRHNLREARDRYVVPFCKEWGLIYEEMQFVPGNGKVLRRLQEVSDQVRFLFCVADAQARGKLP